MIVFASNAQYLNQWAIKVDNDEHIEIIAKDFGCANTGQIVDNTYLLVCHNINKRSISPHHEFHLELESHPLVKLAEQQKVLKREKRYRDIVGDGSRNQYEGKI